MAQQSPQTNILKTEPAIVIATGTALLTAICGALVAFGVPMSDEQQKAVISCVAPAVAVIALLGPIIRALVYSPESAQKYINAAESAGQKGEEPPVTPV